MNFEERMLKKIDSKEELTEKEIRECIGCSIYEEEGESGRWTRSMFTVFTLCGRTFGVEWECGLTEMQENYYESQPYEVEKRSKTVVVEEWVKKEEVKDGSKN